MCLPWGIAIPPFLAKAQTFPKNHKSTYYQLGAYQLRIDLLSKLFPDGEDRPPRLQEESAQAWTLNGLANSYSLSGQPRRAVPFFKQAANLAEKMGNKTNLAIALGNVADDQLKIGAFRDAEANLRRRIALCREIKEVWEEAAGHAELGRLLAYRNMWTESEAELTTAIAMLEKLKQPQYGGVTWSYSSLRELLQLRSAPQSTIRNPQSAISAARRALYRDEKIETPLGKGRIGTLKRVDQSPSGKGFRKKETNTRRSFADARQRLCSLPAAFTAASANLLFHQAIDAKQIVKADPAPERIT